nr:MAG TPA: hypothetical protein [Caudoviricetes sp.]
MDIYAGILNNTVVIVTKRNQKPIFPPDPFGNEILVLKCDETVQLGDKYVDGKLIGTKVPELTQLDRIETAVNKSQQDIIDEYTLELIEGGII